MPLIRIRYRRSHAFCGCSKFRASSPSVVMSSKPSDSRSRRPMGLSRLSSGGKKSVMHRRARASQRDVSVSRGLWNRNSCSGLLGGRGFPSMVILSFVATFCAGELSFFSLRVTRPPTIKASASLRDAIPESAIRFAIRMVSGMARAGARVCGMVFAWYLLVLI